MSLEDDHPGRKACPDADCNGHIVVFVHAETGKVNATHTLPLCQWWMSGLLMTSSGTDALRSDGAAKGAMVTKESDE